MKKMFIFLFLASGMISHSQVQAPQPSPFTKVEQKVGLTDVTIEYSRPGMRNREIFGDLVPFGEVWRTGANDNTKITFSDDVTIEGTQLEKGTYAIFTIPEGNSWEIIFYSDASNWGAPQDLEEDKITLRANAEVSGLPFEMETFTIMIDDLENDAAVLNFIWENTVASLPFEVPTDKKAMVSIEETMNGNPGVNDYVAAASYYHDEGKDLETAYEWISRAVEMGDDDAFWILRRKSLIEADLGKKEEAIATAKQSLAAAEKAGNQDYVKMNKDSLKEWGAK